MLAEKLLEAAGNSTQSTYIEDVFSTYLYTGNGSTQNIVNGIDLAGKGGMTWLKYRSGSAGTTYNHVYDSERGKSGNTSYNYLYPNTTSPQGTGAYGPTSFNSDGFSLNSYLNESTIPYVSWTFRKQPKFFDVVTYTGDGASSRTISHSLGSVPGAIIIKRTDATAGWVCICGTDATNVSYWDGTGFTTAAATYTDSKSAQQITSTSFGVGTTLYANSNNSGGSFVAYLFAHNAGGFGLTGTDNVISCGSFTTSGTSDPNATITLGYEPQFVMFKKTNSTGNWEMLDNMRGWPAGQNNGSGTSQVLRANSSAAEFPFAVAHPTATGFTMDTGNTGDTYIYIAIRRGPMKVPTDGTKVFSPNVAASTGQLTAGFPVDLGMWNFRSGYVENTVVNDRLRGVSSTSSTTNANNLVTSTTAAEAASQGTNNWNNTGIYATTGGAIYYNFRRAPSFFDEVCWTTISSSNQRVSHNLSVVPELIITKARGTTSIWYTYTSSGGVNQYLRLNTTAASTTFSGIWGTAPTTTDFGMDTGSAFGAGVTCVSYLFATCAGVSKVGSYTGNGTTQTINCGFAGGARFVLIKRTDSTGDWYVWDTARGIVSGNDPHLSLNTTSAEVTTDDTIDPDSTGFVVNQLSATNVNVSSATYIYLAIA